MIIVTYKGQPVFEWQRALKLAKEACPRENEETQRSWESRVRHCANKIMEAANETVQSIEDMDRERYIKLPVEVDHDSRRS